MLRETYEAVIPANGSAEWPPDDRLRRVSSTPRLLGWSPASLNTWSPAFAG